MEIRTPPTVALRSEPPQASPAGGLRDGAGLLGPAVEDLLVLSQYVGAGQLYRMEDARFKEAAAVRPPLAHEPRVTLQRPFVMVPGWTTARARFEGLGAKLTEGGINGGKVYFVQDGRFFQDYRLLNEVGVQGPPADAKVFEVVLRDIHAPPDVVASELDRNFEAIREVTGAPRLDVNGYSMGGLGTRVYLDRGGSAVGRFMMLGTPNRGTRFAELARHILQRDIQWAISMAGLVPGDLPALNWMAVDDGQGKSNPRLHALNERWPQQLQRVEAAEIVGGQGQLTPASGDWRLFEPGDGLVPLHSLSLPGTPARILPGEQHHGHLNLDAATYREMTRFFGWTPLPPPTAGA